MVGPTVARSLALGFVLVGLGAVPARAGSITINMTTKTELSDKELSVNLVVSNSGDEAAGSVVPILRLRDHEARGAREESLPPGGKMERTMVVAADDLGEGRWPFRVAVSYTDQNQYPFQALHVSLITRGNPLPGKAAVTKVDVTPLESSADVNLKVKNLAGVERAASVTLFAPEDIEVQGGPEQVTLDPWAEDTVSFEITNRTALTGSRYPVFAAVEYEDGGTHHAILAQGIVEVASPRAFLPRTLLWVVGALLLGWVALLLLRSRSRRAAA